MRDLRKIKACTPLKSQPANPHINISVSLPFAPVEPMKATITPIGGMQGRQTSKTVKPNGARADAGV